jgi:hypothetical protein
MKMIYQFNYVTELKKGNGFLHPLYYMAQWQVVFRKGRKKMPLPLDS